MPSKTWIPAEDERAEYDWNRTGGDEDGTGRKRKREGTVILTTLIYASYKIIVVGKLVRTKTVIYL